jgi:hypothetical protein
MYACANGILPINFGNLFCLRALKRLYESGFLAETSAKEIAPCMSMTASSKTFDHAPFGLESRIFMRCIFFHLIGKKQRVF